MKYPFVIALAAVLSACADDPAQARTSFPQGDVTLSLAMEAAAPLASNRLTLIEGGLIRTPFHAEGRALVARLTDYPTTPAIESLDAAGNPVRLDDAQCDRIIGALTVSFDGDTPRPAVKPDESRTNPAACPFN